MQPNPFAIHRRHFLRLAIASGAACAIDFTNVASAASFPEWVRSFKPRALRRGVSEATYDRVMNTVKPDTAVYALQRAQPEFTEEMWQYINRRCSDFRVITGKKRMSEQTALFAKIERDYGVDPYLLCGLWGMESSFGDVIANTKYMRPIIPALAALAYGEPRRRAYWEAELLNALVIIDRGWEDPTNMIGSWAGAMGHTQWMPEVWLNVGVDYNKDGKVSPFNIEDAFAGTSRYLVARGKYRRGEAWGYEVKGAEGRSPSGERSYAAWRAMGLSRADGQAFPRPDDKAKFWQPVKGGPAFLVGQNFYAFRSYNPSSSYTLALVHLGDRIRGDAPFRQQFPGGERVPTLAEVQELQTRLTALGFDTQGTDGRIGSDTVSAVAAYQRKVGLKPVDGYAGLKVLARLRQGA